MSLVSSGFLCVRFSGFPLLLRFVLRVAMGLQWPPGTKRLMSPQRPQESPLACLLGGRWGQGNALELPLSQSPPRALSSCLENFLPIWRPHGLDGARWRWELFVRDGLRPRRRHLRSPPFPNTRSIQSPHELPLTALFLPPQMHIVHYNSKYNSFDEAQYAPDGLAVLAALIEVGRNHTRRFGDWHPR